MADDIQKKEGVEPVVEHPTTARKKSGLRKFADNVIQEDMKNVKSYIWTEVVVPALKSTISDAIANGVDMILYGEARGGRHRSTIARGLSKISYRDYYDDDRRSRRDRDREPVRPIGYDFDELEYDTKGDAEIVLLKLQECISRNGYATVYDLYEFSRYPAKWTDNKYGWTNLDDVETYPSRGKFLIALPKVRVIE